MEDDTWMLKIFQASRRQIDSISIKKLTRLCLAWGNPLFHSYGQIRIKASTYQVVRTKYEQRTYIHRPRIVAWCLDYWRKLDRVDFLWARYTYESLAFTTARANERNNEWWWWLGLLCLAGRGLCPLPQKCSVIPAKTVDIYFLNEKR